MSSLADVFSSRIELRLLREENSALRDAVRDLRAQLLTEIDSNRTREDELVNSILEASGIRSRAGGRTPVSGDELPQLKSENVQSDIDDVVLLSESEVDKIASQFIDQGPYEYTEEMRVLLKKAIRDNPQDYMT